MAIIVHVSVMSYGLFLEWKQTCRRCKAKRKAEAASKKKQANAELAIKAERSIDVKSMRSLSEKPSN